MFSIYNNYENLLVLLLNFDKYIEKANINRHELI